MMRVLREGMSSTRHEYEGGYAYRSGGPTKTWYRYQLELETDDPTEMQSFLDDVRREAEKES
jgi:hypothetical protein